MSRIALRFSLAGAGLFVAMVGCGGSAATDVVGGSLGGSGNAGGPASTGGNASGGAAPSAGSGGAGGAGTAGAGGGCVEPAAPTGSSCNPCTCVGGQLACTNIFCPKTCGGFAGFTCAANEYCAYMPGQACGAADASSTCQARPDNCTDIYMPVCGCDQKTYPSACDANAHGQGIMSLGACPQGI